MSALGQFMQTTKRSEELKRALAIKMTLEDGHPWQEVAHVLGVSRSFICKWRSRYKREGVASLR